VHGTDRRVPAQQVEAPAQHQCGGLVSCQQQGDRIVVQLFVRHVLSVPIAGGHQPREEVDTTVYAIGTPLCDQTADDAFDGADRASVPTCRPWPT